MCKALINGFRHYTDFRGCASRAEFWNFIIATHLLVLLCMLPAFVEFMKFYNFLLHDVRFIDELALVLGEPAAFRQEAFGAVVKDLAEEYFAGGGESYWLELGGMLLGTLLMLVVFVPTVSVTVRRLRDAGQSPWWVLAPIFSWLPYVGTLAAVLSLVTLVFCCMGSRGQLPAVPNGD